MKLAFSTLGCPGWSLDRVVDAAVLYGFEGVELRGIAGELDIRKSPDFSADGVSRSRVMFEDAGIRIISVDCSARLSYVEVDEIHRNMQEAKDYIVLASEVGAACARLRRLHSGRCDTRRRDPPIGGQPLCTRGFRPP